jgi:hypothetical protein
MCGHNVADEGARRDIGVTVSPLHSRGNSLESGASSVMPRELLVTCVPEHANNMWVASFALLGLDTLLCDTMLFECGAVFSPVGDARPCVAWWVF